MPALVTEVIARRIQEAPDPAITHRWPSERLDCLRDQDVFRWGFATDVGGIPVTPADQLLGYSQLAELCLTTAFIMTQRDAACHRIATSDNHSLRQQLLPRHCSGKSMATVGISHLSTSRQHWSRPSVAATRTATGYQLSGEAPWVTGAGYADLLVTGGSLEDGHQILVAIPTNRSGITISPPLKLLALGESSTGSVLFDGVAVEQNELLAGPVPQVMKIGATGGTGSLTTTAVALGAACRTLQHLQQESSARPDLSESVDHLQAEATQLRADLIAAATQTAVSSEPSTAEQLRFCANSLVMRAAQVLMCVSKGAGFISGHPAERSLREALFFQVWSCPQSVTRMMIDHLTFAH